MGIRGSVVVVLGLTGIVVVVLGCRVQLNHLGEIELVRARRRSQPRTVGTASAALRRIATAARSVGSAWAACSAATRA